MYIYGQGDQRVKKTPVVALTRFSLRRNVRTLFKSKAPLSKIKEQPLATLVYCFMWLIKIW